MLVVLASVRSARHALGMLTIEDIEEAIGERAPGSWTAGETSVWRRLGAIETNGLFGLKLTDDRGQLKAAAEDFDALAEPPPPPRIDWRSADGGRLPAVRDQGLCGACVAFATTAVVEARHWIETGNPLALSEAELFHCNGGSCDDGWGLAVGLDAASKGMAPLSLAPWSDDPRCVDAKKVVAVSRYVERSSFDARQRAVAQGPVVAGFAVFEDFSAYVGGIYRHVAGEFRGNHAVSVVGYDDADQCWIARNSWGPEWGEDGYFRIAYGECQIDEVPFYSCETRAI